MSRLSPACRNFVRLCLLLGATESLARTPTAPSSAQVALLRPPVAEYHGPKPPWRRRRRVGVRGMRGRGQGLVDLSAWPDEPPAPKAIESMRFGRALTQLCGWMPPRRRRRYAEWILTYGREFSVDPFLIGAVVFRQSQCLPRSEQGPYGLGLGRINEVMHRGHLQGRAYRYWVLAKGAWRERRLPLPRFAFGPATLRRAKSNLYFLAALLSIYAQQCSGIDAAFSSVPHRHFVSHLIWGDRVRGAGAEDRILRARRRLIQYYSGSLPAMRGHFAELALLSPLDAPPRKLTGVMGDAREGGRRRHRGIDFSSSYGEPVRAVAAGRVVFAGADCKRGPAKALQPDETAAFPRRRFGPGGLFVTLQHQGGLRSVYMHLWRYTVRSGDRVQAGQLVGYVGRSGIKESSAHLHFELRHRGKHVDPVPYLAQLVFLPRQTYVGRRIAAEQRRLRRRRRRRATGQAIASTSR